MAPDDLCTLSGYWVIMTTVIKDFSGDEPNGTSISATDNQLCLYSVEMTLTVYQITLLLIAASSLISAVYLLTSLLHDDVRKTVNGVIMLLCPVIGIFLFSVLWLRKRMLKGK